VTSSIVSRFDAVLVEVLRGSPSFLHRALALPLAPPVHSSALGRKHLFVLAQGAPAGPSKVDDVTHALVPTELANSRDLRMGLLFLPFRWHGHPLKIAAVLAPN
jgi:hypothetical protein